MACAARRTYDSGGAHAHRLHTPAPAAAHIDAGQHLASERLLYKAPEVADVVFRHQTDGGPAAAHLRPRACADVSDAAVAGGALLGVELLYFWSGAVCI